MEKRDTEFLTNRYKELQIKESQEKSRILSALYRDEMRKINKIMIEKYKKDLTLLP